MRRLALLMAVLANTANADEAQFMKALDTKGCTTAECAEGVLKALPVAQRLFTLTNYAEIFSAKGFNPLGYLIPGDKVTLTGEKAGEGLFTIVFEGKTYASASADYKTPGGKQATPDVPFDAEVNVGRTGFVPNPDYRLVAKLKPYIIAADKVVVDTVQDGFGHATYTPAKGREVSGWIKLDNLLFDEPAQKPEKPEKPEKQHKYEKPVWPTEDAAAPDQPLWQPLEGIIHQYN